MNGVLFSEKLEAQALVFLWSDSIVFEVRQNFARKYVFTYIPANIYLFKINNTNTRKRCELCSKFTIKTPE